MAIDNVLDSTGCYWIAPADFMVSFLLHNWSWTVILFCFFVHSVLVYYLRSKSKARIEMVKLLKQMLFIEAKDKEFLLANITRVTENNGEWNEKKNSNNLNWITILISEWLLEEFTREKPLIRPHRRIIDKYAEHDFPEPSNGKFSFQIGDDSNSSFGKAGRVHFKNGTTSFNGKNKLTNAKLQLKR